jgi:serine protease AprX
MKKEKHQMPLGAMLPQEETTMGKMPGETIEKQAAGAMPSAGGMGASGTESNAQQGANASSMPMAEMTSSGANSEGDMRNVIIEVRVPSAKNASFGLQMGAGLTAFGFQLDYNYEPVPVSSNPSAQNGLTESEGQVVLVRGTVPAARINELEQQPNVIKVWNDTKVEHFQFDADIAVEEEQKIKITPMEGLGTCPIGTCDCSPGTPKGSIADVANYLGVNQIWSAGFKGDGVVVGVVDGGITAQGRTISTDDTSNPSWPNKLIPRVIGGWPTASWGTTGENWGWHGNMCSTDVLGMAPNAQIYDIRIDAPSIGATISNAIAGFQWAIDQHKANGTPQILTNSWGIFQDNWDPAYATDPNHPFTRKVVDALNEGIIVLFAAGNCGGSCPDGRCGTDNGPGKSIWGANGHPRVMTVGAVNKNEQFVGYSSQGPAALDPQKPDFCSVTHFTGFFNSDSGTSAATPIAAGCVALLKQAKPSLTQDQVKKALMTTAKDIGPAGFDQHSGAGIIRPKQALESIVASPSASGPVVAWGPNRLDVFVIGTDSALYHKWWNGASWGPSLTGYENMGGVCISSPEVVSWGPNRLDVFVVGTNSALYHKWWNGASWGPSLTGYENMGGIIQGQPKVVSWGANRLDVFVVGTDRSLYHKWWNGSAWGPSLTGYENLGGKIVGNPEVVCWGPNRIDIFVVGTDSSLYHKWWNGSSWGPSLTGWENLGGTILGQPKVVSWGQNRLDVFVVGTNSALYHKWWNGSAWGPSVTGYENMGGTILGSPEVVSWGPNRLDVFVVGTNSALYHKWWNGSAWGPSLTGYENMGGTIVGQPRVASWGNNRLDVFVIGTNSALYHKWWNGSSWGPSLTGYENMGGVISKF